MLHLAARRQASSPATPQSPEPDATYLFLVFVFTTLPFLSVNAQTGHFIVGQATVSEGANLAFRTCSNVHFHIYNPLGSRDKGRVRRGRFASSSRRQHTCFDGVLAVNSFDGIKSS